MVTGIRGQRRLAASRLAGGSPAGRRAARTIRLLAVAGGLSTGAVCALALTLLGAGCTHQPREPELEIDLTRLFLQTQPVIETTGISMASDDAKPFLGAGWSEARTWTDGSAVAAIAAPRARLNLPFDAPADRQMVLRVAAASATRRRTLVRVDLNRRRVGSFRVSDRLADYTLTLPAEMQQPGENEVTVSSGSLRAVRIFDGRPGDVVVERIAFPGARPPASSPSVKGDVLQLPASTAMEFFARIPPEASLRFDREGDAALAVEVSGKQSEAPLGERLSPRSSGGGVVDVGRFAERLAHITLRAEGGAGSVALTRPRLAGRRPAWSGIPVTRGGRRYNVLLVVVDTLRADHLGCYGYGRPTSPNLDLLAHDAVLVSDVIAQASWTRPAVASILTGLNPPLHGVLTLRDSLRPDVPTLAELLKAGGYATAAFVTNYNVAPRWGLQRGFDEYRYLPEDDHSPTIHVRADELNRSVFPWLDSRRAGAGGPFFLYVHATDPHAPYTPTPECAARFRSGDAAAVDPRDLLPRLRQDPAAASPAEVRQLIDSYDAEIAFVDQQVGALIAHLKALGLYDNTLLLVTADHGEEFDDHGGFEHGRTLFQEQIRVPLLIRFPGGAGQGTRFDPLARQVDILPTVLEYLGVPPPAALSGSSLLASTTHSHAWPDEAYTQTSLTRNKLEAYVADRWKVIVSHAAKEERVQAFDLATDAGERADAGAREPLRVGYAKQSMTAARRGADVHARSPVPAAERLDPATEERLRALGYAE